MASETADGKYSYLSECAGKSLADLAAKCHKALSLASNWKYVPLKPGAFGYDNMIHSIGMAFANHKVGMSVDEIADLVHQGWINNYTFWRDNLPFKKNPLYQKPGSPLGDERRNKCAMTPYAELPEDEKEKDRIIARQLGL